MLEMILKISPAQLKNSYVELRLVRCAGMT